MELITYNVIFFIIIYPSFDKIRLQFLKCSFFMRDFTIHYGILYYCIQSCLYLGRSLLEQQAKLALRFLKKVTKLLKKI